VIEIIVVYAAYTFEEGRCQVHGKDLLRRMKM
jgi:hypothetical protein